MTAKRYFERIWEEEYYIFDSETISESEFDEKLEYENYQAFADSMTGEEVTDRLNKYNKEYFDCHNDVLRLEKENEQLKKALLFFVDVANTECSSNWLEDMEKDCKRLFNCTYEEAKEKYGDYEW